MVDVKIVVNGEEIELSEFPQEIITSVLVAMLETLKGVDKVKTAEITIKS